MDKLTAIKIKYEDGTYSDEIPVSVLSENVEWDSTHTLVDVLGSIDVAVTGTIQDQISQLFNEKVSNAEMIDYVSNNMNPYITNWLNTHVDPVGSAVIVDNSLSISGAAADAKAVSDEMSNIKNDLNATPSGTVDYSAGEIKSSPDVVTGFSLEYGSNVFIKVSTDGNTDALSGPLQLTINGRFLRSLTQSDLNKFIELPLSGDYVAKNSITKIGLNTTTSSVIARDVTFTITVIPSSQKWRLDIADINSDIANIKVYNVENNIDLVSEEINVDAESVLSVIALSDLHITHGATVFLYLDTNGVDLGDYKAIQIRANSSGFIQRIDRGQINKWIQVTLHNDTYFKSGEIYAIGLYADAGVFQQDTTITLKLAGIIPKQVHNIEKDISNINTDINTLIGKKNIEKQATMTAGTPCGIELIDTPLKAGMTVSIRAVSNVSTAYQIRVNDQFIVSQNTNSSEYKYILPDDANSIAILVTSAYVVDGESITGILSYGIAKIEQDIENINSSIENINSSIENINSSNIEYTLDLVSEEINVDAESVLSVTALSDLHITHGATVFLYLDTNGVDLGDYKAIQIRANSSGFIQSLYGGQMNKWIQVTLHNDTYFKSGEIHTIKLYTDPGSFQRDTTITLKLAGIIPKQEQDIKDIKSNIADINSNIADINSNIADVPSFYTEHLLAKEEEIKAFERAGGVDYDSFVFVTDTHVAGNRLYSANLIKHIIENTSVDKIFFGGDACSAFAPQSQVLEEQYKMRDTYQRILAGHIDNLYFIRGNHDIIGVDKSDSENPIGYKYDDETVFSIYARNKTVTWGDPEHNKLYFYFDDNQRKMRYICLDSTELHSNVTNWFPDAYGITQGQAEFLIQALNEVSTKAGWAVVVCCHVQVYGANTDPFYVPLKGILQAFQKKTSYSYNNTYTVSDITFDFNFTCDFTNRVADFVGVFSGHRHDDYILSDPFVQIVTAADTRDSGQNVGSRVMGTVTESLFDVVCINKKTKAINIVRIGAGSNRQTSYALT